MPNVAMPRLSDSMEEGTILQWLKADGDEVAEGEELIEIETDKAAMTYESDLAGVLRIVARQGDTLAVGSLIAVIGEPEAEPEAEREAEAVSGRSRAPSLVATDGSSTGVKASPTARRMARRLGITLSSLAGSGPRGRVLKADVEAAARAANESPPAAPPTAARVRAGTEDGDGRGQPRHEVLTRIQQTVARRMAEAKATAPDFVLEVEVDMTSAMELREQLKAATGEGRAAPSFNDFVIRSSALALAEFPRANGAYKDGCFELYPRVNVGIAVAGRDALLVPTIMDADQKSLGRIASESRALAERVRDGTVTANELASGTFTVSNLGMHGIRRFVAVLNPPQAGILAVGEIVEKPVARGGEITVRLTMHLTLTCDHRILYGADAAQFLGRIRERLENPLALAM